MNIRIAAAALAASSLLVGPSVAQNGVGTTGVGTKNVCLWSYEVDHTKYVAPQTVLFYLKNGVVWRNTLKAPCPGLKFHGFSLVSQDQHICANSQGIRVIESGEVCALGAFTPNGPEHAGSTANP